MKRAQPLQALAVPSRVLCATTPALPQTRQTYQGGPRFRAGALAFRPQRPRIALAGTPGRCRPDIAALRSAAQRAETGNPESPTDESAPARLCVRIPHGQTDG